jgi:tRNA U34 2-thiouridine synthase MnmA/TrmU
MTIEPQRHHHPAIEHTQKHFHVTHYLHRGEDWAHLQSTHTHAHNHPELEHVHIPHQDLEKEHRREAHIHDHARPAASPA